MTITMVQRRLHRMDESRGESREKRNRPCREVTGLANEDLKNAEQ